MKKSKNSPKSEAPKSKRVVVKPIAGHRATKAFLAALKAVAAMGHKS